MQRSGGGDYRKKSGGSGQFGWLIAPSEDPPANLLTPTVMRTSARRLAGSTSIPPVLAGRYIWEKNFAAVTAVVDSGPHTVLHGDSHPGNTFFRNGHGGLLDWQVVRRGHPSRDLAYAIVLGTPVGERAGVERDLIDTYRTALAARGRTATGPRRPLDEVPASRCAPVSFGAGNGRARRHARRRYRPGGLATSGDGAGGPRNRHRATTCALRSFEAVEEPTTGQVEPPGALASTERRSAASCGVGHACGTGR